jgi:hypothetical protein
VTVVEEFTKNKLSRSALIFVIGARQRAEGRRQKAEGRRQKAEGRRQKAGGKRVLVS